MSRKSIVNPIVFLLLISSLFMTTPIFADWLGKMEEY